MLIAVSFTITALNDFTDNELQEKDNYRITEANSLEMVLTAFLRYGLSVSGFFCGMVCSRLIMHSEIKIIFCTTEPVPNPSIPV